MGGATHNISPIVSFSILNISSLWKPQRARVQTTTLPPRGQARDFPPRSHPVGVPERPYSLPGRASLDAVEELSQADAPAFISWLQEQEG